MGCTEGSNAEAILDGAESAFLLLGAVEQRRDKNRSFLVSVNVIGDWWLCHTSIMTGASQIDIKQSLRRLAQWLFSGWKLPPKNTLLRAFPTRELGYKGSLQLYRQVQVDYLVEHESRENFL